MKYILTLLCFAWFTASAQEPAYTPMRLNYQFRGIRVDSLLLIPQFLDTTSANTTTIKNIAGSMIRTGNDFWMRNAATTAWLQNVNVGNGASVNVQFVDSIYRIAGKDSIFWRKSGVVNKIKDSIKPDAPNRINGTATGKITSIFDNNDWDIQSVNYLTLSADRYEITSDDFSHTSGQMFFIGGGTKGHRVFLDTNLYRIGDNSGTILFTADTTGNSTLGNSTEDSLTIKLDRTNKELELKSFSPVKWIDNQSGITSQVKTGYGDNGIDIPLQSYYIVVPGVYIIAQADIANQIELPDATLWKGQSFTIVNTDNTACTIASVAGTIYDGASGNTLTTLSANKAYVFFSDGTDFYGIRY